jgi:HD-like signal output (HDOD) protein
MGWVGKVFRGARRGQPPPLEPSSAAEDTAKDREPGSARARNRFTSPLLEGDERSRHPVQLRAGLDGGDDPTSLSELARSVEEMVEQRRDPAEQSMLGSLARAIRTDRIRLPTMPEVILRVQRLLDQPNCRMSDLAAEIEREPALATRFVGIANSPFYAGLEPVRSVQDALVRVGLREAHNVVMALAVHGRLFRVPGFDASVRALWEHALAASVAAQSTAAAARLDPDLAFFAGLVHDIGRVAVLSLVGDWQRAQRSERAVEPALVGALADRIHARLGALLGTTWRLAPEIVQAIAAHHEPALAPERAKQLAQLLGLADELAHRVRRLARDANAARAEASAIALGIAPDALDALADETASQIRQRFAAP